MTGKGKLANDLYFFIHESSTICSIVVSPYVWHLCLGHPSYTRLHLHSSDLDLFASSFASTLHYYQVCHLAKHNQLPFPSRNNMALNTFDLVYIDV